MTRLRNTLGSDEIKIGVDWHKLYIRWRNTDPYSWENLYSQEDLHFKNLQDKKKLIDDVCSHLMIASRLRLSKLVGQLSDNELTVRETNLNVDLGLTNLRLKGETLHLMSDVLGTPVAALQEKIDYIGQDKRGWGVIRNPNLETDPVDVISRLVGIVMSDGHIDPNCHITYPDAYPDRLARVRETVNMLGDVDMTEKVHSTTGVHYIHIPAVVGGLLVKAGMLTGDKAIRDERLPEIVRTAPNEAEAAYTKELTADDGCFAIDGRSGEFSWGRSIVLDAGNKSEGYEHKPLISEEEIEFVKTHGERKTMSFGGSKLTVVYAIQASEVKQLKEGGDPKVAPQAAKLRETIESNPPRLMEDERQLCHNIGIATRRYPITLRVFESGRVSVFWQAQTSSYKDAMVWGLVATPNDARKSEKVSQWLSERVKLLVSERSRSS